MMPCPAKIVDNKPPQVALITEEQLMECVNIIRTSVRQFV
jgi:hypothetical protein